VSLPSSFKLYTELDHIIRTFIGFLIPVVGFLQKNALKTILKQLC